MARMPSTQQSPASDAARAMFCRMLALWASDLIGHAPRVAWKEPEPPVEFRDNDWKKLYAGSVLDD